MAKKYCINPNDPDHKALIQKMGSQVKAQRLLDRFEHLGEEGALARAKLQVDPGHTTNEKKASLITLRSANVTPPASRKAESIQKLAAKIGAEDSKVIHDDYMVNGEAYDSVSKKLDGHEDTKYRGEEQGMAYADAGTGVHTVFEDVGHEIMNGKQSIATMNRARENGIDEKFVNDVRNFLAGIYAKHKGKFLMEVKVYDEKIGVAGTIDLVHLRGDGLVDIYDYKTAFYTSGMARRGEKTAWAPNQHFGGYKGKRYPTQLEYYSRMLERTINQPVSNVSIIPVEVRMPGHIIENGFESLQILPIQDTQNLLYGVVGGKAGRIVDEEYGVRTVTVLPTVNTPESVNEIMTEITGEQQGKVTNPERAADRIMTKVFTDNKGVKRWKNPLSRVRQWLPFKNQKDERVQRQEIIDTYVNVKETARRDVVEEIKVYLQTGDPEILSNQTEGLLRIVSQYRYGGQPVPGIQVYELNQIEGFKGMVDWIVIENTNTKEMQLIYYGRDNIDVKLNLRKKLSLAGLFGNPSLFAEHMTAGQAKYLLGSDLKDTMADSKKFEATAIMLQLKHSNSDINFAPALIHSSSPAGKKFPYAVSLAKTLPILQKALTSKNKNFRESFPLWMRNLAGQNDLFDYKNYQQDLFASFTHLAKIMSHDSSGYFQNEVNKFLNKQLTEEEMRMSVLDELASLDDNPDIGEEEDRIRWKDMLAQMNAHLQGLDPAADPITWANKWISMPTNIKNNIIQNLMGKMRAGLANISRDFFNYKDENKKDIKALFKDQRGALGAVGDFFTGATSRFYEPLMEETEEVVVNPSTGKSIRLKTFFMVEEGSDKFRALSEAQQKFIVNFNNTIQKHAELSGIDWERGKIPLVPAGFANKFFQGFRKGTQFETYRDMLENMFDDVDEMFSFTDYTRDEESVRERHGQSKKSAIKIINPFASQTTDRWETLTGVYDTGLLYDKANNKWSTNLEVVLDMFVISSLRTAEFNKLSKEIYAADALFQWQKSGLYEGRIGTVIKWLDVWTEGVLLNRSQDAGTLQMKLATALNKWTSLNMIGFRPMTAVIATAGQQLTAMSQAIAQSFGNDNRFSFTDWMKAGVVVWGGGMARPARARLTEKIDALLQEYRMFNHDFSSIVSGYHRIGNTSAFRMKWAYSMLNAGDWGSRAQIMVAQMMHDGVWDAYSIDEDGNLKYDETKDKRFQGEEGAIWKRELKKILGEERGIVTEEDVENGDYTPDEIGNMKRAYDNRTSESIKAQSDSIIGGFDRETRGIYSYYWYGKLLGLFKTWLPARLDKGFDARFYNEVSGNWELVEDMDGEKYAVWKGKQMEGLMQTFMAYMFNTLQYARGGEQVELTDFQKENFRRLVGDVALLGLAVVTYSTLPDEDEETQMDDGIARVLNGAVQDLVSTYNILLVAGAANPIAVEHTLRVLNLSWNAMAGITDPNDRSLEKLLYNTLPGARGGVDAWTFMSDNIGE